MKKYSFYICALLCFPSVGWANSVSEDQYSPTYRQCIDNSGGADFRITACEESEQDLQKKLLSNIYRKTLQENSNRKAIQNSQTKWESNLESSCSHAGDMNEGGTAQGVEISGCITEKIIKRKIDLENLLKNKADNFSHIVLNGYECQDDSSSKKITFEYAEKTHGVEKALKENNCKKVSNIKSEDKILSQFSFDDGEWSMRKDINGKFVWEKAQLDVD